MTLNLRDPGLLKSKAFIGGNWVTADEGDHFDVTNPASGEVITSVPRMGEAETRRAIEIAETALPKWRTLTAKERSHLLRAWFDLIISNEDDLAAIMTAEQGKPIAEALGEIRYAASFVEWFAEEAKRAYGDIIPSHKAGSQIIVTREPVGVTAAITPWNFPSAMITRKVGRARRDSRRGVLCRDGQCIQDRGRNSAKSDRTENQLHRIDRNRQAADGCERGHLEKAQP